MWASGAAGGYGACKGGARVLGRGSTAVYAGPSGSWNGAAGRGGVRGSANGVGGVSLQSNALGPRGGRSKRLAESSKAWAGLFNTGWFRKLVGESVWQRP